MTTTRRAAITAAAIAAVLLGFSACASSASTATAPSHARDASARVGGTAGGVSKVLVVIEENHSYAQMKQGMPFLGRLADTYGYATHWTALAHPSLPNYLGIASGTTFGIRDDRSPAAHASDVGSATSVFDQAIAAGRTAGTYAEAMPQNCHVYDFPDRSVSTPEYAVRHNPWVYFGHGRSSCLAHDRDLSTFAGDAARDALPNVGFLIPELDHDAHDGSLATADAWIKQQLTPVLRSRDFTSGRLVVVVTADEDDNHSGNTVLTSVLTPRIHHEVVDTPLTHYSLTRYLADVLGVKPLKNAATAPDMGSAFGL